jgi:formylglycine-generating enzyme required for sulfatase activity
MIELPGGTFRMGSADGEEPYYARERPQHSVTLARFWMAKVLVTQRLYKEVTGQNTGKPQGDDLPINRVLWHEAIEFCNRLSMLRGLEPVYQIQSGSVTWNRKAGGYRLPTEAEWEYAARGLIRRPYPWGSEPPSNQLCWNGQGNDLGPWKRLGPTPVGSYPRGASPWGLLDMAGNVWEWCWDVYGAYPASPQGNPAGPQERSESAMRVIRGGSWYDVDASWMRGTARNSGFPTTRADYVGFRCVRGTI